MMIDPYRKLRPPLPTPEEDICACADAPPIVLQSHLSENPISCLRCNLEMPPERLGWSKDAVDGLAYWRQFHDCFYLLWLDSREFDGWAKAQLEDAASPVNTRGLALVAKLNAFRRTYYWWFQDNSADDWEPLSLCPRCGGDFVEWPGRLPRYLCEPCSIAVAS
jgi:hypothetical protein